MAASTTTMTPVLVNHGTRHLSPIIQLVFCGGVEQESVVIEALKADALCLLCTTDLKRSRRVESHFHFLKISHDFS